MNAKQLAAVEALKNAITQASKVGVSLEYDPEVGELNAIATKEGVKDYNIINRFADEDDEYYDLDNMEECTADDIFDVVTLSGCSMRDDDDDIICYVER